MGICPFIDNIIYFVGFIVFLKFLKYIILFIYKFIIKPKNKLKEKYGDDWVIITGGSEGIGFGIACSFAKRGHKICIISRSENKLISARDSILKKYPNAIIKYIMYDFNKNFNESEISELESKFNEFEGKISILVNNVGQITEKVLLEYDNQRINSVINVNIKSIVFLTKIILKQMVKREKNSLIVASGSISRVIRPVTQTIYASTKCFLESFHEIIHKEYPKIDTTYLCIGMIETSMNRYKTPFKESPEDMGESCINLIGKFDWTGPHINDEIIRWFLNCIPWFLEPFFNKIMKKMVKEELERKEKQKLE